MYEYVYVCSDFIDAKNNVFKPAHDKGNKTFE